VHAFTTTPVFRTDALVQVEEQQATLGGIEELSSMLGGDTPTAAEIEIIRSRMVLAQAIEQEDLHIGVEPKRFPLIGSVFARRHRGEEVADPRFGLDSYAWGGERVQIDRLEVDRSLQGQTFTLVAGKDGGYTVLGADQATLLTGKVGAPATGAGVAMFVSELRARPQTEFAVVRRPTLAALSGLLGRLSVAERGRQTGILELALEGTDPDKIAATLNAISNIYLRQNVERRSEEAGKTLQFLNDQLPELKSELDAAGQALNHFRVKKGSIDLSLETQGMLEQLTEIERQISEMELTRVERAQLFTAEHPSMLALNQQREELVRTRTNLDGQIRELPAAEQDALRLMRDVRVADELYSLLLNRAQELRVVRAGTIGNVRIIDTAYAPSGPVKPRKSRVLFLGLVLGGMLGVAVVFVRQALDSAIRDPKALEQHFGMPVYAIVPRSEAEIRENEKDATSMQLIALDDPHDPAVESLRSLRTSIEFLFHESPNRILTIGGPAPEVGKSFVSANVGALMAQAGRRVLLVDADLRRGHLHRKFTVGREPGLSELIAGQISADEAVQAAGTENLFLLPSGRLPPNPAELLVSRRFEQVLAELAQQYDAIVLDAPPVLAASEAATLAKLAGINLLVVRCGQQNRREVELAVDRLVQAGARPNGFIFNDLAVGSRRYAYAGYRYYRYEKA
jgi:tyrosine-protein kinase Etk/Wzc